MNFRVPHTLGKQANLQLKLILAKQLEQNSRLWLQENAASLGKVGLHLLCGDGQLSLEIASHLGEDGLLYAVYERLIDIKSAQKQAMIEGLQQLQFISLKEWLTGETT
ncbi:MAG: hypothetical protein AAFR59_15910, partial [Bacteroidota bacterium]